MNIVVLVCMLVVVDVFGRFDRQHTSTLLQFQTAEYIKLAVNKYYVCVSVYGNLIWMIGMFYNK